MKIGIITYHRAHNYGAVLQCYALQKLIQARGHNVEIIDYRQPFIEKLYGFSKFEWLKGNMFHPRNLLNFRNVLKKHNQDERIFADFRRNFLNISKHMPDAQIRDYDIYIIGSDQMWSINCVGNKIDNVYFGEFVRKNSSKLIGFSISSNADSIVEIGNNLNRYANNFDDISFREETITNLVNKKLNKQYITTIDPTLCVEPQLWDNVIDTKWGTRPKYIVLYHVKLRFASIIHKLLLKQAQRLADFHKWEIVDLSSGNYNVSDFTSAIKYAQCVITTSFHATVFSIIFDRPYFSVKLHDGGDERYVSLLKSLGMDDSLVDLDFDHQSPIIYNRTVIHERLNALRIPSLNFLYKYI